MLGVRERVCQQPVSVLACSTGPIRDRRTKQANILLNWPSICDDLVAQTTRRGENRHGGYALFTSGTDRQDVGIQILTVSGEQNSICILFTNAYVDFVLFLLMDALFTISKHRSIFTKKRYLLLKKSLKVGTTIYLGSVIKQ